MNIYAFSILCFSFGVLLIAALALNKRSDASSFRFLMFSIVVCGWGFAEALWINQIYDAKTTLLLTQISNAAALFIPITWLHFVFDFIGEKKAKIFYLFHYSICFVLLVFSGTPLFISGLHSTITLQFYPTPGPFYNIFTLSFFLLVPYGFYYLVRAYLKSSGQAREQLKYLIIGTVIGFSGGSITFIPLYFYTLKAPLFLVSLMSFYPFFMGIALIRYGLFDTERLTEAFQREKLTAIGTIAASLNHELKNPLFIARGKAETFLDQIDRGLYSTDTKAKDVVASIQSQLARAGDIMQKFSDFAKPFYKETRKENVPVETAFKNVLQLVSAEFEMNKIQVDIVPADGLNAFVNPRHFEEILFNLMINACHAMSESGGHLKLNAYQPNGKVLVEISDNGLGIPKDKQKKIFDPFYSTKGANGSGLGLYITKQLIERNGGKIKVESKLGQGTTFRLELAAK